VRQTGEVLVRFAQQRLDPFVIHNLGAIGSLLVQENGLDYASGGASLSANFEV
jgi:hypothetical protein